MYNFLKSEKEVTDFWVRNSTFEKSNEQRQDKHFVFYDGPPFATGTPHYGHFLVGTIKDVVARYKNMQGHCVPRQWGWDCHGVPVESLVQKKLGLSRVDIVQNDLVEEFNKTCRESVFGCVDQWRETVSRMGRWVDFENSYKTMDNNYMESVWWVFKQIYDQGRIYKAKRVMPYSCKLQTTLSNSEVSDSYREVEDPYVVVKFRVKNMSKLFLLAYTTTPWTLPSNSGLCVNPNAEYSSVYDETSKETYVMASDLVAKVMGKRPYQVKSTHLGDALRGMTYHSLYGNKEFPVVSDSFVTTQDGTGVVHLAPAFGEDDYRVGQRFNLELIDPLDAEGKFTWACGDYKDLFCKEADDEIISDLRLDNKVFKCGTIKHDYPFCDRTNSPLIYRAVDAWYLKLEDIKDRLLKNNATIKWVPESVGTHRFANWLENAKDWNISRNRLWGSCLPIWESDQGDLVCFGSVAELEDFSGFKVEDLHKDHLDKIVFSRDGKTWKRVPEVLDCWFESGSMPYAQYHYPFENKELVEKNFPADFIVEGLDQTRGWFYTLLVLSTLLFDKAPFKNVIVNGMILAEDGTKMSKSKKNYTDVNVLLNQYGADALRAYFCSSPSLYAEPLLFKEKDLVSVNRSLLLPLSNAVEFFKLYSSVDSWKDNSKSWLPARDLDIWILTRFTELLEESAEHMENYDLGKVLPKVVVFLDDLCNWYIRSSRKVFWESGMSDVKDSAYKTLSYVLVNLTKLMAPFVPFIAEHMFHELGFEGSVHLEDFPEPEYLHPQDKKQSLERMNVVRTLTALGHNLRVKHSLKVKQPLANMTVCGVQNLSDEEVKLLKEELNLKNVLISQGDLVNATVLTAKANFKSLGKRCGKNMPKVAKAIAALSNQELVDLHRSSLLLEGFDITLDDVVLTQTVNSTQPTESDGQVTVMLDTSLTPELLEEGDFREVCSFVQNLRKNNKFNLTDRVLIKYSGSATSFLSRLDEFKKQVLALEVSQDNLVVTNELKVSSGSVFFELVKG
jgi:isoleucyl-tRNA synthetase